MTASNFGIITNGIWYFTFSWNDATLKGVTLPDTAVLFVLRFTALGSLSRSIPVSITGSPTSLEFYDSYYRKKASSVRNGSVNLVCRGNFDRTYYFAFGWRNNRSEKMSLTGTENKKAITDKNGILPVHRLSPATILLLLVRIMRRQKQMVFLRLTWHCFSRMYSTPFR